VTHHGATRGRPRQAAVLPSGAPPPRDAGAGRAVNGCPRQIACGSCTGPRRDRRDGSSRRTEDPPRAAVRIRGERLQAVRVRTTGMPNRSPSMVGFGHLVRIVGSTGGQRTRAPPPTRTCAQGQLTRMEPSLRRRRRPRPRLPRRPQSPSPPAPWAH